MAGILEKRESFLMNRHWINLKKNETEYHDSLWCPDFYLASEYHGFGILFPKPACMLSVTTCVK